MPRNLDVVNGIYEAFARGDVPAVLASFDPEIEWNEAENFPYADGNPYRGPEAVLEGVFARLGDEWDGFAVNVDEIHDAGDTIIARGRYRGTFKETGRGINAQFAHVWWLQDGKVTRFQQHADTAQVQQAMAD